MLFAVMFAMGCFASIYHPAGLAIISRETTPENRGAALGWHGIVGSLGIAGAPFIAAVVFRVDGVTWRMYYAGLLIPAGVLAVLIATQLVEHRDERPAAGAWGRRGAESPAGSARSDDPPAHWRAFAVLVISGALSGFVYAAFMHFLPRYLDEAGFRPSGATPGSFRNLLAALVLACGIGGQALAGRLARPGRLEWLLAAVLLASAPLLAWMAVAQGPQRLYATCTLAFVHFMNQPVYNSLVAQYVPRVRRSVGYGFSNMLTFGVGAFGPAYAGLAGTQQATYLGLAGVAALAALLTAVLPLAASTDPAGTSNCD
jgi:predicted MFS family arabinose efflux permease